jgi:hypothetical protein
MADGLDFSRTVTERGVHDLAQRPAATGTLREHGLCEYEARDPEGYRWLAR